MKYSQLIGVAAVLILVAACFMPWAWYPDLSMDFTGFYSLKNIYGKPGKIMLFLGGLQIIFFLLPRIWAKRANILVSAFSLAFALKSFILYGHCYTGICPEKRIGLYLMMGMSILAVIMALLPDLAVKDDSKEG